MLPAHWTLPASISVLCDFYGQINQYLICDSLLTPANPMERSVTECGRQLHWLRPSRGLNRTSGRTCVDRLRTLFSKGETSIVLTERAREQPPSPSPSFERLASAVGGMWAIMVTSSDKTKYRCRWCMIMLRVQRYAGAVIKVLLVALFDVCVRCVKSTVWWEAGQQTLLRTVTEHTAVKSFCQSDLRHGAINQQVLERTWKQQSHDGWVNAASSHSSHWVWVRGKRGGWRSGLPAATSSSSRDLHISDRPTGGKCKIQLLAFFFLVQISHLFFCACVLFF